MCGLLQRSREEAFQFLNGGLPLSLEFFWIIFSNITGKKILKKNSREIGFPLRLQSLVFGRSPDPRWRRMSRPPAMHAPRQRSLVDCESPFSSQCEILVKDLILKVIKRRIPNTNNSFVLEDMLLHSKLAPDVEFQSFKKKPRDWATFWSKQGTEGSWRWFDE